MFCIIVNRLLISPQIHGPYETREAAETVRDALDLQPYVRTSSIMPLRTTEVQNGQLVFTAVL